MSSLLCAIILSCKKKNKLHKSASENRTDFMNWLIKKKLLKKKRFSFFVLFQTQRTINNKFRKIKFLFKKKKETNKLKLSTLIFNMPGALNNTIMF